jgi:hypothetical protein
MHYAASKPVMEILEMLAENGAGLSVKDNGVGLGFRGFVWWLFATISLGGNDESAGYTEMVRGEGRSRARLLK